MDFILLIKYLLLGLIQGLTEPLPISSSAHVFLASRILKMENITLDFEIILNFASFLAIAYAMKSKIFELIKGIEQKKNDARKYLGYLIIGSIPACIIGFLFKDYIDVYFLKTFPVGMMLLITTILLLIASIIQQKQRELNILNAMIIGIAQACALVPGLSRSGTTLFGGRINRVSIEKTLTFSFLLYLIASFGSIILSIYNGVIISLNIYIILSFLITFVTTYWSIKWFVNIISQKSLIYFAIYTFFIGLITVFLG